MLNDIIKRKKQMLWMLAFAAVVLFPVTFSSAIAGEEDGMFVGSPASDAPPLGFPDEAVVPPLRFPDETAGAEDFPAEDFPLPPGMQPPPDMAGSDVQDNDGLMMPEMVDPNPGPGTRFGEMPNERQNREQVQMPADLNEGDAPLFSSSNEDDLNLTFDPNGAGDNKILDNLAELSEIEMLLKKQIQVARLKKELERIQGVPETAMSGQSGQPAPVLRSSGSQPQIPQQVQAQIIPHEVLIISGTGEALTADIATPRGQIINVGAGDTIPAEGGVNPKVQSVTRKGVRVGAQGIAYALPMAATGSVVRGMLSDSAVGSGTAFVPPSQPSQVYERQEDVYGRGVPLGDAPPPGGQQGQHSGQNPGQPPGPTGSAPSPGAYNGSGSNPYGLYGQVNEALDQYEAVREPVVASGSSHKDYPPPSRKRARAKKKNASPSLTLPIPARAR